MNELKVFSNEQFGQVRTVVDNGKVWFCGKDAAKALGYDQPHKAVSRHCRYGTKHTVPHPQAPNKTIEMSFIPEGDLYRLITHSQLPSAEKFESWVFDEVLPEIRTTGSYAQQKVSDEQLIEIARIISKCSNHNLPYVLEVLKPMLPYDFKNKVARCHISKNKPYLPDNFNAIFSEAIRNSGLSITELEKKTGVSRNSIYRYMNCGDKPTRKTLDKFKIVMNIEYL